MPKLITERHQIIHTRLPYVCQPDKTRTNRPIIMGQGSDAQQTPKPIQTTKSSTNKRCNRAVELAEKEWNPYKTYETNGENRGDDITRYRYGVDNDYAWCATFFNYVYNPEHIPGENVLGMSDQDVMSTQKILKRAKGLGCFADAKSGYTPKVGDALVWQNNSDAGKGHIGIIVEVRDDGSFVTIQGNNNDKVQKIEYSSIEDAMRRTSSSGSQQTLQGFIQMSKYNDEHNLAEERSTENDSLITNDATGCWLA